jgi:hypothetical protein
MHRNVGAFFDCRFDALVDLRPVNIAHTQEVFGLNTCFRPVVQKPQSFSAGITACTLNATEFFGTNGRRTTTCQLDNELFESGVLRTSVSSDRGEVDHPLFLAGAASLSNSLESHRWQRATCAKPRNRTGGKWRIWRSSIARPAS